MTPAINPKTGRLLSEGGRRQVAREAIEPCTTGRCFSPVACSDFGYCRDRNSDDPPCTPEKIAMRRRMYGLKAVNADQTELPTQHPMRGWWPTSEADAMRDKRPASAFHARQHVAQMNRDRLEAELRHLLWQKARAQAVRIVQGYATEAAEMAYGDALAGRDEASRRQTERMRLITRIADDLRTMEYEP